MNPIDYLIVFVIVIVSFYLVWRLRRKIAFEDFIIAKGSVDATHFLGTYVGTNISVAGVLIGITAAAYTYGLQTLWIIPGWLGATLLFLIIAINKREFFARKHTLLEFMQEGYKSRVCQLIAAFITIVLFWGSIGVGLLAIKRVFELFTPFALPIALFAMTLAIFYTLIGGYRGVLATDVFQIIALVITLFIIPLLLVLHGRGIQTLVDAFKNSPIPQESPFLLALGFLILTIPFQIVSVDMWLRTAASKKIKEAVKGMLWSLIIFSVLLFIVITIGLWAYSVYPKLPVPDVAFSLVVGKIAPIGVLGLILGSIVAAAISTADTSLITVAQTFFYDVSQQRIKAEKLRKLRVVVLITGLSAMLLPLLSPSIVDALFAIFSCQLALLPSVLGIFFLKENRRHASGAIASMVSGFVVGLAAVVLLKQVMIAPIATLMISSVVYAPFACIKIKEVKK